MATLRESIQTQINTKQIEIDVLEFQLGNKEPGVPELMNADMNSLSIFFKLFKAELGL